MANVNPPGSGVSGGGVSGGGGSVDLTYPDFQDGWTVHGQDFRFNWTATSTIQLITQNVIDDSGGHGPFVNFYTKTVGGITEFWRTGTDTDLGFYIEHFITGGGDTRPLVFRPSDSIYVTKGTGITPGTSGDQAIGQLNTGWKFLTLRAIAEPATPTSNAAFVLYVDEVDGKLKAKGASGTVTPLANP